ncbi:hypothetical protein NC651_002776 [Populus alba x Populus x berolinensis]|nr:hypothetical protein NC651_002776 [Populus alba x Populus x berolinensis]
MNLEKTVHELGFWRLRGLWSDLEGLHILLTNPSGNKIFIIFQQSSHILARDSTMMSFLQINHGT